MEIPIDIAKISNDLCRSLDIGCSLTRIAFAKALLAERTRCAADQEPIVWATRNAVENGFGYIKSEKGDVAWDFAIQNWESVTVPLFASPLFREDQRAEDLLDRLDAAADKHKFTEGLTSISKDEINLLRLALTGAAS